MATIDKIDLTNANSLDYLSSNVTTNFQLVNSTNGSSTLELAGGRSEAIGEYLYEVNDGDFAIDTTAAVSNGNYYIHVLDSGSGSATCYLDSNVGTWDANKGGYYYTTTGAKVIGGVIKSGSDFINRGLWHDAREAHSIGEIFGVNPA